MCGFYQPQTPTETTLQSVDSFALYCEKIYESSEAIVTNCLSASKHVFSANLIHFIWMLAFLWLLFCNCLTVVRSYFRYSESTSHSTELEHSMRFRLWMKKCYCWINDSFINGWRALYRITHFQKIQNHLFQKILYSAHCSVQNILHTDTCSVNVCRPCVKVGKILHKLILSLFSPEGHFAVELAISPGLHVFNSVLFLKCMLGEQSMCTSDFFRDDDLQLGNTTVNGQDKNKNILKQ